METLVLVVVFLVIIAWGIFLGVKRRWAWVVWSALLGGFVAVVADEIWPDPSECGDQCYGGPFLAYVITVVTLAIPLAVGAAIRAAWLARANRRRARL